MVVDKLIRDTIDGNFSCILQLVVLLDGDIVVRDFGVDNTNDSS